jgi:hypothetical protein
MYTVCGWRAMDVVMTDGLSFQLQLPVIEILRYKSLGSLSFPQ